MWYIFYSVTPFAVNQHLVPFSCKSAPVLSRLRERWNMKSYTMIALVLLTCHWMACQPVARAMQQQPAVQADATDSKRSAGTSTPSAAPAVATSIPAKGSFFILAEFTQSLNAKKLKPGDQVKAEVTQDVLSHGKIIIPVESKLVGHVTEVKSSRAEDSESRLGIVFDKVLLKHRVEVEFHGVLHALSAPAVRRSRVDEPDQMLSPGLLGVNRSSGPTPVGSSSLGARTGSGAGGNLQAVSATATNPAGSPPSVTNGAPVGTVPTVGAGNAAGGIPSHNGPSPAVVGEQKPMSVGMPLGVFGLKGLSLSTAGTASTPGPVIFSRMSDVKLESGTQVLLKVTDAAITQP
jgi:hypothetical protein